MMLPCQTHRNGIRAPTQTVSRHVKMAIVDWRVTPQIAINDPKLMVGMPPSLTAATGMDALTHAIEAYVSTDANPLTDAAALMAITMITQYLPKAVANGIYMKARDKMAYGQYLAGIAFNNASLGYVHAMAHQLGRLLQPASRRLQRDPAAPCRGIQPDRQRKPLPRYRKSHGREH